MKLHELVEDAYQVFLHQADSTRIVLLHPESRYRSMLVARLINDPDYKVFYYALGPDDIKLSAFLAALTHDMADQHPTFGRHINMLPQHVYDKPQDHLDVVMQTFGKELAEITDDRFFIVFDEYDRSDTADDVQRFVELLASYAPENCRVVVNSRTLPRLPWVSLIADRSAVMLKDSEVIIEDFYDSPIDENAPLEVFALGPGFVVSNGKTVDTWEGHLPRLLFFFALDRPIVTRSEICHAFWPELEADQAVNVFHVTKRRLHKALDTDVLVHDNGYYRINPSMTVYYDVVDLANALMTGRNASDEDTRFAAWQRAAELYRGPFLQGHSDTWIDERREHFRAGYLEALTEMANVWVVRDRHEQALTLLQRALQEDNHREDLHQEVMRLFAHLGRRSEAAGHFQKLKDDFEKEGLTISEETQTVYNEIML